MGIVRLKRFLLWSKNREKSVRATSSKKLLRRLSKKETSIESLTSLHLLKNSPQKGSNFLIEQLWANPSTKEWAQKKWFWVRSTEREKRRKGRRKPIRNYLKRLLPPNLLKVLRGLFLPRRVINSSLKRNREARLVNLWIKKNFSLPLWVKSAESSCWIGNLKGSLRRRQYLSHFSWANLRRKENLGTSQRSSYLWGNK